MIKELTQQIQDICLELYDTDIDPELSRPEEKFGDYSTNVALRLAKKLGRKPKEITEEIKQLCASRLTGELSAVTVEGPGFINFQISDKALVDSIRNTQPSASLKGQTYLVEYSDPNPFKILHAGHLYTTLVGDVIASLLKSSGAEVHRLNYGGDVGLHVAKSMWAILQKLGGENPQKLSSITDSQKLKWLSDRYIEGNSAYDEDPHAKNEIIELNKRVYSLHEKNDQTSDFAKIYWTCRKWSYEGFDDLYKKLQVHEFEKYYPESAVATRALKIIREQTGKVYEESDGAVVFPGEEHGLHTRVFITKEGIPTYEAKDIGLIFNKRQDYKFDRSVVITANEQAQYMQVVLKSLEQFEPKLANSTIHLTHGTVKLRGGVKMSSRKGNFLTADDVLMSAKKATLNARKHEDPDVTLGAIKYAFLKNRIGGDIMFDPDESVSLEGNSGPYLQYALVRAKSIVTKSRETGDMSRELDFDKLDDSERSFARQLSMYPEVFDLAAKSLSPHHLCNYLYETCQAFNRFYENSRVIGDPRQEIRLTLVNTYKRILQDCLDIMGIPKIDKM